MPFDEGLDGFVDVFLGVDAVGDEVVAVGELVVEDVDEVAGAVGAGDLAVAEEVGLAGGGCPARKRQQSRESDSEQLSPSEKWKR